MTLFPRLICCLCSTHTPHGSPEPMLQYLQTKWGKTFEIQAAMLPELLQDRPFVAPSSHHHCMAILSLPSVSVAVHIHTHTHTHTHTPLDDAISSGLTIGNHTPFPYHFFLAHLPMTQGAERGVSAESGDRQDGCVCHQRNRKVQPCMGSCPGVHRVSHCAAQPADCQGCGGACTGSAGQCGSGSGSCKGHGYPCGSRDRPQ